MGYSLPALATDEQDDQVSPSRIMLSVRPQRPLRAHVCVACAPFRAAKLLLLLILGASITGRQMVIRRKPCA
jgi:hypothetical protein